MKGRSMRAEGFFQTSLVYPKGGYKKEYRS
jgi:hypothetical protein